MWILNEQTLPSTAIGIASIDLYSENAIAIESEASDPNGGNVYYVTIQITYHRDVPHSGICA